MKREEKKLLDLGKQVAIVVDAIGADRKRMMYNSFLRGIAQGFGAVVGGTILVAILLWILGLFNQVPLLGPATNAVSDTIQQNN